MHLDLSLWGLLEELLLAFQGGGAAAVLHGKRREILRHEDVPTRMLPVGLGLVVDEEEPELLPQRGERPLPVAQFYPGGIDELRAAGDVYLRLLMAQDRLEDDLGGLVKGRIAIGNQTRGALIQWPVIVRPEVGGEFVGDRLLLEREGPDFIVVCLGFPGGWGGAGLGGGEGRETSEQGPHVVRRDGE